MNNQEVITLYETVADITGRMLAAARTGDWDQLAALECQCSGHVQTLRNSAPQAQLAGEARDRKIELINKILADDREIRSLTDPWMARLVALMNSTGTERKLSNTYGANQAG